MWGSATCRSSVILQHRRHASCGWRKADNIKLSCVSHALAPGGEALDGSELVDRSASKILLELNAIDKLVARNTRRVSAAFRRWNVNQQHVSGARGSDQRETWQALDGVIAEVMGTEDALCRLQIMSGTHAISCALYGVLRPGDELLAVAGDPYDTMEEVIGSRGVPNIGSLRDLGVSFRSMPLNEDGLLDYDALPHHIIPGRTRVCHIQRSCGYTLRPTLTVAEIGRAVAAIRAVDPGIVITVDNCYGEFTEAEEPGHAGADLVMGSLIKNPGGNIVTGGGYVAGRADLVKCASARLTAPGQHEDRFSIGGRHASTLFQGLWLAPSMVGEALKGGRLIARVMADMGYTVVPRDSAIDRPSFITAVEMGSEAAMVAFCETVQNNSPVGSYIQPTPGVTPGYGDAVIFADGTFVDGSTAELSADGPIRPPYVVYCQGGTHWVHWQNVLKSAVDRIGRRAVSADCN